MDDLISRQAVKELAHNQVREKYCGAALKEHRDFYIKLADSIIDLLPSVQPEQRWIPCSERLPEVGQEVLVCYDFKGHRSVLIGCLYGDGKFHGYDDEYLTVDGRKHRKAVAWMPLPEPYREERTEE